MANENGKLNLEYLPLSDLKRWPRNPKDHDLGTIHQSIQRFDFNDPIAVNVRTGYIVEGHGRVDALQQMKAAGDPRPYHIAEVEDEWLVPTLKLDMDEKEAEAYGLAHNRLTELGGWNDDQLAGVLSDLAADDLLDGVGWDGDGVDELLRELKRKEPKDDPGPQTDKAAELNEKWKVELGQLWELGDHRVMCGDCTDADVVERVMDGEKADLLVTSPPYFNQREYSQWKEYAGYLNFAGEVVTASTEAMAKDSVWALNIGSDEPARRWMPSDWWVLLRDAGWEYRECIAWKKAAAVWSVPRSMHIENGHYFPALRWEVILVVAKGKHPKFEIEDRDRVREFQSNVWEFAVVAGTVQTEMGHPGQFPLEMPNRLVTAYTTRDKAVYEPFLGSGTTLIACELLGRRCRGVELEPKYVAVTLQRWADMTDEEPKRLD